MGSRAFIEVEMKAVLRGLQIARDRSTISKLWVHLDSSLIVGMLQGGYNVPADLAKSSTSVQA